jgi:hypothetical protein
MQTCPYCGEQAMPVYKKAFLGPGRAVPCDNCERPVSVNARGTYAAMLPVIALLIGGAVLGMENTLLLLLVGAAIAIPLHVLFVPLETRD